MKSRIAFLAKALLLVSSFTTLAVAQNAAVDQVNGPIWITVPTSAAALQSLHVKAPANGNMIVTVTGTMIYEHTLGTQAFYCLQLSETAGKVTGCVPDVGSDSAVRASIAADFPTTVPGYGASEQYSIVKVWPVTGGDAYTFYLNGYETSLDAGYLFQPSITALFVPGTLVP